MPESEFISTDLLKQKSKFSGHGIFFINKFCVISGGNNFCAVLILFKSDLFLEGG